MLSDLFIIEVQFLINRLSIIIYIIWTLKTIVLFILSFLLSMLMTIVITAMMVITIFDFIQNTDLNTLVLNIPLFLLLSLSIVHSQFSNHWLHNRFPADKVLINLILNPEFIKSTLLNHSLVFYFVFTNLIAFQIESDHKVLQIVYFEHIIRIQFK